MTLRRVNESKRKHEKLFQHIKIFIQERIEYNLNKDPRNIKKTVIYVLKIRLMEKINVKQRLILQ